MQLVQLLEEAIFDPELTSLSNGPHTLRQLKPGQMQLALNGASMDLSLKDSLNLVRLCHTAARNLPVPGGWGFFPQYVRNGLPGITPGMGISSVLASIADYLRTTGMVREFGYSYANQQISCQMATCPLSARCPLSGSQSQAAQLLCRLCQASLARAGYTAKGTPAPATSASANVAFKLELLNPTS